MRSMEKESFISTKWNIETVLISLVMIYCVLFPADKLNIKEIILAFAIFICYTSDRGCFSIPKYIFGYAIVFPLVLTIYALIRGASLGNTLSYGYVWVYLLLLPAIVRRKIDVLQPFIFATYVVALIIDVIMIFDLVGIYSIYQNPIAVFFQNMNELQGLGKGVLATFGYSIFYKSCPLIIVTYGYFIKNKKYLLCIPLLVSMLACGTRANFLMVVFITAAIPVLCSEKRSRKMLMGLIVLGVAIYLIPNIYDRMITLNALKYDRSESIKISDVKTIFESVKNSFLNLLFGTGVGSSFYSARGHMMTTFEMSYVDYFRQVGAVGFSVFIVFIIKPIRYLYKYERWLFISYVGYLAISFTNPLLVTSTSFMLYLIVYSRYHCKEFEIQDTDSSIVAE